jgi:hypothetical protein
MIPAVSFSFLYLLPLCMQQWRTHESLGKATCLYIREEWPFPETGILINHHINITYKNVYEYIDKYVGIESLICQTRSGFTSFCGNAAKLVLVI